MWMLFSGEDESGVCEWERRLKDLERSYRKLFPGSLDGYSLEEEIARFNVCLPCLQGCATPSRQLIVLSSSKSYRERLKPLVVSATPLLSSSTSKDSTYKVLVEGANALML